MIIAPPPTFFPCQYSWCRISASISANQKPGSILTPPSPSPLLNQSIIRPPNPLKSLRFCSLLPMPPDPGCHPFSPGLLLNFLIVSSHLQPVLPTAGGGILPKLRAHPVYNPLISFHFRMKIKVFNGAHRTHPLASIPTPLAPPSSCFLGYSCSRLFLKSWILLPLTGPLHSLFPLPRMLLSRLIAQLAPTFHSALKPNNTSSKRSSVIP